MAWAQYYRQVSWHDFFNDFLPFVAEVRLYQWSFSIHWRVKRANLVVSMWEFFIYV